MLIYALIALSTAPLVACKGRTSITRILKDFQSETLGLLVGPRTIPQNKSESETKTVIIQVVPIQYELALVNNQKSMEFIQLHNKLDEGVLCGITA